MKIILRNSLLIILVINLLLFFKIDLYADIKSTFSPQRLTTAISDYVARNTDFESVVKFEQAIKDYKFEEEGVVASISHNQELRGVTRVALTFTKDNNILKKDEIRIRVFLYANLPLATKFIAKGDTLTSNNVALGKCDITNLTDAVIENLSEINSQIKIAKTGIPIGNTIKIKNISSNSDITIKKNSQIKVLHYAGAILIRFNAIALEDGAVGDVIKIKKDNSQTLQGFVAEDGNVIVENKSVFSNTSNKNNSK